MVGGCHSSGVAGGRGAARTARCESMGRKQVSSNVQKPRVGSKHQSRLGSMLLKQYERYDPWTGVDSIYQHLNFLFDDKNHLGWRVVPSEVTSPLLQKF